MDRSAGNGSEVAVLVVEDDEAVQRLIVRTLEREGIEAVAVTQGGEALRALRANSFDLVILDLQLPDSDGLDVLARLQDDFELPTIIVSGRTAEGDRVLGLTSGADDYVVKPFSPRELTARVQAVLRRAGRTDRGPATLEYGDLVVDLAGHEVRLSGEVVDLTPQEFQLLAELARRPRRACSRDELLAWAWRSSAEYQDEATVTEHVRRLRHKLEADPAHPTRIVTVRGVGYRFDP